ncbi:MAG: DMT family transporter [Candidatus Thermoplasmatota archaeon]
MDRRQVTGLAFAFAAFASWGLLSPVSKRLLDDFEPLGANAVRFALATLLLLPWLGRTGLRDAVRLLRRREVLWFNLLANVSLTLFLFSLVRLEPTFSTLGFYSAPLWTALLAAVVLKERMGPWFAPAAAGLLAGGYLTLFGPHLPGPGFESFGMALALGSAVIWAWYAVELRRHAPSIPLKPLMGANFLFGTAWYYGLAVALEGWPNLMDQSAQTWGWVAVHVAFPTLASFILFNAALQRAPAGPVNILIAMELAFTVLFSWLLFGEDFTTWQLAGLGLALASVSGYLWSQWKRTKPAPDSA